MLLYGSAILRILRKSSCELIVQKLKNKLVDAVADTAADNRFTIARSLDCH